MAYILHDIYDWYRDLMDNKSGMWAGLSESIV